MLIGEYRHVLDSKRRVSLPAKLRKEVGASIIVTRGVDKCLYLYQEQVWSTITASVTSGPASSKKVRDLNRLLYAGAEVVDVDASGRILIPEHLCAYADLQERVLLAGVLNRIEMWDEDMWNTYMRDLEKRSEDLVENIHGQNGA